MRVGRAAEESVSPPRGSGTIGLHLPALEQLRDHEHNSKLGLDGRLGIGKAFITNVVRSV